MSVEEISHYKRLIESLLIEAQNYDDMFNPVRQQLADDPELLQVIDDRIKSAITKSKQKLKKSDRIVWFLRQYRAGLAIQLMGGHINKRMSSDNPSVDNASSKEIELRNLTSRFLNDLKQKSQGRDVSPRVYMDIFKDEDSLLSKLAHFFSLPIPAIQNFRFEYQSLEDVYNTFEYWEDEWKKQAEELIPYDPSDGQIIMKFPDGFFWQNLNREYCRAEGSAMGHCGNSATPRAGDKVLSLRKFVTMGDKKYVRPSLTFILQRDGYLGEMKGRANQKPNEKYHPYIIELLRSPIVKGIRGGGYAAHSNFSLMDLEEPVALDLIKEKPRLASAKELLDKFGPNSEIFRRSLNELVYQNDIEFESVEGDTVILETIPFSEFLQLIEDKPLTLIDNFSNGQLNVIETLENQSKIGLNFNQLKSMVNNKLTFTQFENLQKRLGVGFNKKQDISVQHFTYIVRDNEECIKSLTSAIKSVIRKKNMNQISKLISSLIDDYISIGWTMNVESVYADVADSLSEVKIKMNLRTLVNILSSHEDSHDAMLVHDYQNTGWVDVDWYETASERTRGGLPSKEKDLIDFIASNVLDQNNLKEVAVLFAKAMNLGD